jgi:hypothetical protein
MTRDIPNFINPNPGVRDTSLIPIYPPPIKHGLLETYHQWEFQDPKMEVLYHIRPYFMGIFPYIGLKNRPYIW